MVGYLIPYLLGPCVVELGPLSKREWLKFWGWGAGTVPLFVLQGNVNKPDLVGGLTRVIMAFPLQDGASCVSPEKRVPEQWPRTWATESYY